LSLVAGRGGTVDFHQLLACDFWCLLGVVVVVDIVARVDAMLRFFLGSLGLLASVWEMSVRVKVGKANNGLGNDEGDAIAKAKREDWLAGE
jgi:hypothetical protein